MTKHYTPAVTAEQYQTLGSDEETDNLEEVTCPRCISWAERNGHS